MAVCINTNSLEFVKLTEHFDGSVDETHLKAAIALWQKNNGIDNFPTIGEVKGVFKSVGIDYSSKYQGDINPEFTAKPFTLNNDQSKKALKREVLKWLKTIGVTYQPVKEILDEYGNPITAVGEADLIHNIIRVVEDKASIKVLPEEASHVLVGMLKGTPLFDELLNHARKSPLYGEVTKEYSGVYNNDEEMLAMETAGKLIAQELVDMRAREDFKAYVSSFANYEQYAISRLIKRVFNYLKKVFSDNKVSSEHYRREINPFRKAALRIKEGHNSGNVGDIGLTFYHLHNTSHQKHSEVMDILNNLPVVKDSLENFYRHRDTGEIVQRVSSIMKAVQYRLYGEREASKDVDNLFYADKGVALHKWEQIIFESIYKKESLDHAVVHNKVAEELKKEAFNEARNLNEFIFLTPDQYKELVRGLTELYKQIVENTNKINKQYGTTGEATILTELPIINKDSTLAGTLDLLVVYPNGKVAIYDYKNIKFRTYGNTIVSPIPEYKLDDFNARLTMYKNILASQGITDFAESRIIPINVQYNSAAYESKKGFTNIQMHNSDISDSDNDFLEQVSVAGEELGLKSIDSINGTLGKLKQHLNNLKGEYDKTRSHDLYLQIRKIHGIIQDLLLHRDYRAMYTEVLNAYSLFKNKLHNIKEDAEEITPEMLMNLKTTIALYKDFAADYMLEMGDKITELDERILRDFDFKLTMLSKMVDQKSTDFLRNTSDKIDHTKPGKSLGSFIRLFAGMDQYKHNVFHKLHAWIYRAQTDALLQTEEDIKVILEKHKALEDWAKNKGISMETAFGFLYNKKTGGLYGKYSKKFYEKADEARKEQNLKFFLKHYQVAVKDGKLHYTGKAAETYKLLLERATRDARNNHPNDPDKQARAIQHWKNRFDITSKPNLLFSHDNFLVRADLSTMQDYFSDEYKYIQENSALRDYYEMYVTFNERFSAQTGRFIDKKFVGNIRRDTLDLIAKQGGVGVQQFAASVLTSLETREENSFYSEKDEEIKYDVFGQRIHRVPLFFMDPLQEVLTADERKRIEREVAIKHDKKEDPLVYKSALQAAYTKAQREKAVAMESKSNDLSRTLILMARNVNNYETLSLIESQANLLLLEAKEGKTSTLKDTGNKRVIDRLVTAVSAKVGIKADDVAALETFINRYIYGKNNQSEHRSITIGRVLDEHGNVITPGKKISSYSIIKFIMKWNAAATLGGKPTLIARNAIQVKTNVVFLATEGVLYNLEHLQNAVKLAYQDSEKYMKASEFFNTHFTDKINEKANNVSINNVTKWVTMDKIFYGLKETDESADRNVVISMMQNYGIEEDGTVRRLSVLKNSDKRSILDRFKINSDGSAEIEGMTKEGYYKFRHAVQDTASKVKGTSADTSQGIIYASTLGEAVMQFRSWMPGLTMARFRGVHYNLATDTADVGRFYNMYRELFTSTAGFMKTFTQLTVNSLPIIGYFLGKNTKANEELSKIMYEEFKVENPESDMSFEEFVNMRIGKIRAMASELRTIIGLYILKMLARNLIPDDDEDNKDPLSFVTQIMYRVLNGAYLEASFFVDINSTLEIFSSPVASIGMIENLRKLLERSSKELVDVLSDPDLVGILPEEFQMKRTKRTPPYNRYFMKFVPLGNGISDFTNFYDDFSDKKR